MESPGAVGRRRGNARSNVEDQALDQIAKEVSGVICVFVQSIQAIYGILQFDDQRYIRNSAFSNDLEAMFTI